jgi:hypothetical protein
MDALAGYLANRAQRRRDAVDRALATLRPYERRLVREAAVMGYVLGRQDGVIRGRAGKDASGDYPRDAAILADVIAHCITTDDLYPYLAAASDGRRRRVTKARQWPGEEAR